MNARVLELIKNPELFQNQDLELLSSEIKKQPYIQNIRALQLYGIHKFRPDEYQNALSTTAAYTTDKKILYQFINKSVEKNAPTEQVQPTIKTEETKSVFTEIESIQREQPKPVYVNGVLNRILFEGEEDFLEQKNDVIDLESTLESGQIVVQSKETDANAIPVVAEKRVSNSIEEAKEIENPLSETIQSEEIVEETDKLTSQINQEISEEREIQEPKPEIIIEKEILENNEATGNPAAINFHGTAEFLSKVKIANKTQQPSNYEVPKPQLNKHEIEIQRLIAEVEAKMKSRTKTKTEIQDEEKPNTDLDFSETQNFEISEPEDLKIPETKSETAKEIIDENIPEKPEIETAEESVQEKVIVPSEKREWKPMSFAGNTPDALIGKVEIKAQHKTDPSPPEAQKTEPVAEIIVEEKAEERPVFNVSFFTQNVSPIESEKVAEKIEEKIAEPEESNVPTFINTWQNWLKIDRNQTPLVEPAISKAEVKNTVIENFIVKEPRISKLKEESDFVVKEKGDNISHLMTETLAKLYVEQKLYSKAIKAYHILSEKHPEKKSHFSDQINYIKDLRQNK